MIYKNPKTFQTKIGNDVFLFVNEDDTEISTKNMIKLIKFLNENKIDFEYTEDDEFKYGLRIALPSKEIYSIHACEQKDLFSINYDLEDGYSCDWEPSFRQLTNFIRRYPNHNARK
jgi:hypothetical protein